MPTTETTLLQQNRTMRPDEVLRKLPDADYLRNYQPAYPDSRALLHAIEELQDVEPVTTPRQIDLIQVELTKLARGEIDTPIIITGPCAEEVGDTVSISELVDRSTSDLDVVRRGLGRATLHMLRNRGQHAKPRSAEYQQLTTGEQVVSYMGGCINGTGISDRTPDPARMIAAARQDALLEAVMTDRMGWHVPAAHEALLLASELSGLQTDPETGDEYLITTDMPWGGKRTNQADSPHIALLARVRNPVGVKIGADSTPDHIASLVEALNPRHIPGRLTFMLRTGPDQAEARQSILLAIHAYAPESLIMYDIHGVTKTADDGKTKIRSVPDIIADIQSTAHDCRAAGLKLHGLHLETTADIGRLECIDDDGQLPTHPGNVDPQLNPRQTATILEAVRQYLL